MKVVGDGHRGGRGRLALAAIALMALSSTACTVAVSPSPAASATPEAVSQTALPTAPGVAPESAMPSIDATGTPLATVTPTETPWAMPPDPSPTPAPPLPKGPLPSLGPVPTGDWTGIDWIAIPGGHAPAVPASPSDDPIPTVTLLGSSNGYLEVLWNPFKRTLTPWFSGNGLTWKAGKNLDTSAWTTYMKGSDHCVFRASTFEEDPQASLLRGFVVCGDTCGPLDGSASAAWVSSDGVDWTPATIPDEVGKISGGSTGFVALGSDGSKASLWMSPDGRAWTKGTLPAAVLASGASVSSPVSIAGGFVLPGVVAVKTGHNYTGAGCAGSENLSKLQAALWWSPDGKTWTRDILSGANPTYASIAMSLVRVDDHTVVAIESGLDAGGMGEIEWVSSNGQSWARVNGSPIGDILTGDGGQAVEGRDRGLFYDWTTDGSPAPMSCFNDKLALVTLKQTGDAPWWDDLGYNIQIVMGPTGVLATDRGTRFWIGVPTVG